MGTIVTRLNSNGSKSFKAEIVVKKDKRIVFRESKTFSREALAKAWIKNREFELESREALEKPKLRQATLCELIDLYLATFVNERTGRTKVSDMKRIKKYPIAEKLVSEISCQDLIKHIIERRKTVCRATAGNDLIWIHAVYKVARPAFNIAADLDAIEDAQTLCYKQGLTGKSEERDRRPTCEEMSKLMEYFTSMPRSSTPYAQLYLFLLFSGRRCSEMTRIRWKDIEPRANTVYIENVKHPRNKWGNHMRLKLTDRALTVINQMPRGSDNEKVFRYSEKTLSTIFSRACSLLDINDLHMHDLRHECTSNLFEMGYQIHQVALFTGHRSWNSLKRYTHLTELGVVDKWQNWEWLP